MKKREEELQTGLSFKVIDIKTGKDVTTIINGKTCKFWIDSEGFLYFSDCPKCYDDINSWNLKDEFKVVFNDSNS